MCQGTSRGSQPSPASSPSNKIRARTPSARPNQACEGLQQGGLSAPVLSRDAEDTPRLDDERNRPEGTASEGAREVLGDKPHGDSIIGPAVLPPLLGVLVFLAISVY